MARHAIILYWSNEDQALISSDGFFLYEWLRWRYTHSRQMYGMRVIRPGDLYCCAGSQRYGSVSGAAQTCVEKCAALQVIFQQLA